MISPCGGDCACSGAGTLSEMILSESSLVAVWPFNDASGNAVDASGNGNDLTPVDTPTYGQPGPFASLTDTSIKLDGADGFNQTAHDQFQATTNLNIFNGTSAFTMEMIVLPTDNATGAGPFWYYGGGGDAVDLIFAQPDGTGQGLSPIFQRGGDSLLSGVTISQSTWTHLAVTYDGTTMIVYVAGAAKNSRASAAIATSGTTGLYVGRVGVGGGPVAYFRGYIAWGALYSSALSAATILAHASSGIASAGEVAAVRTVTAAYSATATDQVILAAGTFNVTLPAATTAAGRIITVKNNGAGTVTVARTGGDTIDGAAANVAMAVAQSVRALVSDGAGWWIAGSYL